MYQEFYPCHADTGEFCRLCISAHCVQMTSQFCLIHNNCSYNQYNDKNYNRRGNRPDIACAHKLPFLCHNTHRRTACVHICQTFGNVHCSQCYNKRRDCGTGNYITVKHTYHQAHQHAAEKGHCQRQVVSGYTARSHTA